MLNNGVGSRHAAEPRRLGGRCLANVAAIVGLLALLRPFRGVLLGDGRSFARQHAGSNWLGFKRGVIISANSGNFSKPCDHSRSDIILIQKIIDRGLRFFVERKG